MPRRPDMAMGTDMDMDMATGKVMDARRSRRSRRSTLRLAPSRSWQISVRGWRISASAHDGPRATLKMAVDLMYFPSQVRLLRSSLCRMACSLCFASQGVMKRRQAKQPKLWADPVKPCAKPRPFSSSRILFYPDADSYRVLGARPEATETELRRNMALLLRWLHPDLDPQGQRSVFATRVTRAWNDLKITGPPRGLRSIDAHGAGGQITPSQKRYLFEQQVGSRRPRPCSVPIA